MDFKAGLLFGFAAFSATVIGQEYVRGVRARRAMASEPVPIAFVSLVRRNRRRYGGYLVHLGVITMFVGVAASSVFQKAEDVLLRPGQTEGSAATRSRTSSRRRAWSRRPTAGSSASTSARCCASRARGW